MPTLDDELVFHKDQANEAKRLYIEGLSPARDGEDWASALRIARSLIADVIRDSDYLADVAGALRRNGKHMLALRSMMAPPISQDQFGLACRGWSKGTEHEGKQCGPAAAIAAADEFHRRRDRALTRWVNQSRKPTLPEIKRLFASISGLLASQQVATARRNRLAAEQERAVVQLLLDRAWTKLPSVKEHLDRGDLPLKQFMHKARFATKTTPQEVDIACGLKGSVMLAMECKVTNDVTNSIKRVNDVIKKAEAWRDHYGSYIQTAALLQGQINPGDVKRLLDKEIAVFWSHDLKTFEAWLDSKT